MMRLLTLATVSALVLTVPLWAADEEKKPAETKKPATGQLGDPEAMYKKLDADSDGKVTKEEFKQGLEQLVQKLPNRPQRGDKVGDFLFKKLDTDNDGQLSLDEFKKIKELRGEGKPGAGKIDIEKLKELREKRKQS